ncbi:MAG: ABC transporter ATP-binding protein [Xanthomonadales bacterium]|nr:ABC transporter ATP-binding protein [Gammaproteobacteria bacterium]MBT8052614.1 ABC transporter ATP-binding protein [Gammaproteobacteria bacterium]NND56627.1 ABC transporter ATP-binding protein [Xanthomonadales bacterium]NNK52431.1 ABC transporter ATP-binding protein [Xanthomonadales bacterium]
MKPLVRIRGVSKFYPRVHRPRERLRAFASLMAGSRIREGAEVLHDVSLEVTAGQSFGIIGENGAGKSTLLKILTGVISPSRGSVEVNARIAALLELGAGFQPEFSGIDNVRMKSALLGMSASHLDAHMDEILAFADIGDYVYEPVKHYSSGMVVRLGFAVVAASDPQLLITDEVLAVGDEAFQKKCIRWIESFLDRGNTLLMVSHSMYLVQKLCRQALWLHDGRMREIGDVFPVTQSYLAYSEERTSAERRHRREQSGDSGLYRIKDFALPDQEGERDLVIGFGGDLRAELVLHSPDGQPPVALFGVMRADGTPVYGVASDFDEIEAEKLDQNHFRFRICFDQLPLLPGSYSLRGHAMDSQGIRLCDTAELRFSVAGESREMGMIRLPHSWNGQE